VAALGDPDDAAGDRDALRNLTHEPDHRDHAVAGRIDARDRTTSAGNPPRTRADGHQRRQEPAIARRKLERQRTEPDPGDDPAGPGRNPHHLIGVGMHHPDGRCVNRQPGRVQAASWEPGGDSVGARIDPHDLAVRPRADPEAAGAKDQWTTAMANIQLLRHPAFGQVRALWERPHRCRCRSRPGRRRLGAGDAAHHGEQRDRANHGCTNSQPVTL